jgi:hypothetical protein
VWRSRARARDEGSADAIAVMTASLCAMRQQDAPKNRED